jgi:hypothetical protein
MVPSTRTDSGQWGSDLGLPTSTTSHEPQYITYTVARGWCPNYFATPSSSITAALRQPMMMDVVVVSGAGGVEACICRVLIATPTTTTKSATSTPRNAAALGDGGWGYAVIGAAIQRCLDAASSTHDNSISHQGWRSSAVRRDGGWGWQTKVTAPSFSVIAPRAWY